MLTKGMTGEEIAAAFFVPVNVVKQRLRPATVSPALHDVYADDGMTLEQLMAFFTVSENHCERPPQAPAEEESPAIRRGNLERCHRRAGEVVVSAVRPQGR